MKRTVRWVGVCLVFSLGWGVAGMQAQQPVSAEPQAPSSMVQTPRELVPALPVPRLVKFAGTLNDDQGKPRTGLVGVTFAVYKEQEGGAALWLETQNVELDEQGRYAVLLGSTKSEGLPLELFSSGEPRWLGVQVNLPGEVEQPRVLLVSVPYALKAADAENLGGRPASSYALATGGIATGPDSGGAGGSAGTKAGSGKSGKAAATAAAVTANFIPMFTDSSGTLGNSVMIQSGGNIGLGTLPGLTFDVNGGVRGIGLATGGRSISPDAINTNALFLNGSNAMGVSGTNVAFAPGALFTKTSFYSGGVERMTIDGTTGNVGVGTTTPAAKLHVGTGNNSFRVEGPVVGTANPVLASWGGSGDFAIDAVNVTGGRFIVKDGGNVGIGTATPTGPLEVDGVANVFANGEAILGQGGSSAASSGTGQDGIDVFGGTASGSPGFGGFGVFAQGGSGNGTGGIAGDGGEFDAGTGFAGGANGFAGFFRGNVQVTGAITAGVKDFKIDHPLDPANKYLAHASVESSEMLNIYSGNATLDASGSAPVSLPGWFETVNKDFRYQLTAIGAPGPNLYIAQEIQGGRFVIAGGQPGMKVSWQVTGVRQDAFAKAHPLVVEEEKLPIERGHYIHPELYGAPEERGIQWARHPQLMKKMREQKAKQAQAEPVLPAAAPIGSHPVATEPPRGSTKQ